MSSKGQSTLITTSIYIGIIVTAAVGVTTYMGPLVDDLSDSRTVQQMLDSMTGIEQTVRTVADSGIDTRQTFSLSFQDGSFQVDAGDDEISYTLDTSANIISPGSSRNIGNVKLSAGATAAVNTSTVDGTPCWQVSNTHISACIVRLGDPIRTLQGFYELEGNQQTVTDGSKYDNTGVLGNTDAEEDTDPTRIADCLFGGCMRFDGNDDLVTIDQDMYSDNMTYSLWVRPEPGMLTDGEYHGMIGNQGPSGQRPFNLWKGSSDYSLHYWLENAAQDDMLAGVVDNYFNNGETWYHVVMTKEGDQLRIYRNGEQVKSETLPFTDLYESNTFQIGAVDNYWAGDIDHVAVYNHSMNDAEVQARYRTGTVRLAYREDFDPLLRYENTDSGMTVGDPVLSSYVNGNRSSRTGFVTTVPVELGDDLSRGTVSVLMKSMTGIDYRTDISALSGSDFLSVSVQED